jgi:threonine synthase
MKYISTRGNAPILSFEEAMLTGLARDGGLYVPESVPTLSHADIAAMAGKSYEEIAFQVMRPFVGDTFTDAEFTDIISKAYANFGHSARAPMVQLDSNHFLLELFHGPTLAFKDFAMQLIGQLFQVALNRRGDRVTIVGATSGDTGSAAIEAFRGLDAGGCVHPLPTRARVRGTAPSNDNTNGIECSRLGRLTEPLMIANPV